MPASSAMWGSGPGRAALAAMLVLSACSGLERLVTPGRDAPAPARVALSASIALSRTAADVVTLEVEARYLRADGSQARLGTRTIPLTTAKEQEVPIAFELSSCLSDPARDVGQGDVACHVVLVMALAVNGTVVDRQLVGPLVLKPGATTSVTDPVALFEITGIEVAVGAGPVLASGTIVDATVGVPVPLRATVRERAGGAVAGRAVTWTSEAPAVATVDADGLVTPVGPGTATVSATIEAVRRAVTLRVVRAPEMLSVVGDGSSGRGTIRSTPAGIDCRVADGVASGACALRFAADSVIVLRADADAGAAFQAWEDGCDTGSGVTCTVTMRGPRAVRSRFVAMRHLVVSATGDGTGRVSGPAGLDCLLQGASVSGPCDVMVPQGARVALVAAPGVDGVAALATFAAWGGDCEGVATTTCPLEVPGADVRVSAGFRDGRFLRVSLDGSGDGNVAADVGIACARTFASTTGRCTIGVPHGTMVTLVATAGALARFDGWSGACEGSSDATCRVALDASRDVSARFSAMRRLVVASAGGDGRGHVRGPSGLDCLVVGTSASGTCSVTLPDGSPAVLTATPDVVPGFPQTFTGWGDDCASAATASCVLPAIAASRQVAVRFRDAQRLDVGIAGTGSGRITAPSASIDCRGTQVALSGTCRGVAAYGTTVNLVATPDPNVAFLGWAGACVTTAGATCTVTMDSARTVVARFARMTAPLTLVASGTGGGALLLNGQPACLLTAGSNTAGCTTMVDVGSQVTIAGQAATGSTFGGLTGDCTAAVSCTMTVAGPLALRGRFDHLTVPLALTLNGAGGGSLTIDGKVACSQVAGGASASCTPAIPLGNTITIAAVPASGAVTTGVTGACTALPCNLKVTAASALAVQFDPGVALIVAPSGVGGGTVTASIGISCTLAAGQVTGTCTSLAAFGSTVVLTATPSASSMIGTWGGACTGQVGPTCRVAARERRTATIRFDPVP